MIQLGFRGVTGGVLEDVGDGGRRILRLAQLGQLPQEVGRGGGVGDAEGNLGEGPPVLRAELSRKRILKAAGGAELIAESLARDVEQMGVGLGDALDEREERLNSSVVRPSAESVCGATLDKGIGVIEVEQDCADQIAAVEGRLGSIKVARQPATHLRQLAHSMHPEQSLVLVESGKMAQVVELIQIQERPECMHLRMNLCFAV